MEKTRKRTVEVPSGSWSSLVVCQAAGLVGAIFTTPAIPDLVCRLGEARLHPAELALRPAWTTLFVLMGLAAFLIWRRGSEREV
jgi:benzodiazapine receptor